MAQQELPLPDYDELPLGTLRHRMRALNADELRTLLDHEREHADRTPVIALLTSRLDELAQGATPSPGSQEEMPEVAEHKRTGSPVTPSGPAEPGRSTGHGTVGQTGKGIEHSE
ncbi:hypothetical protein [Saccharopolyspora gloriosae]|uniref:hypothetical protein n=1 Tax=Saccharopolyspora gloriosae TaxID=455344 RepID=UPI001FB79A0C|nr:hypothetical protein [Saccharopolyspora gloriosae]